MSDKQIKVLLEMRPAFEGYAGIPQEVRLLFRELATLDNIDLEGLMQTSHLRLSKGTKENKKFFSYFFNFLTNARRIGRYSNVIISLIEKPYRNILEIVADWFHKKLDVLALQVLSFTMYKVELTNFKSKYFEDFIWRTLFSKTLPAADFDLVCSKNYKVCSITWTSMHMVGLGVLNFLPSAKYPKLNTKGFDVFIGQTPYPALINKKTAMVIRYHDAIPIFMPHTINEKAKHHATHFYALKSNLESGAWFACVSESTRRDLIKIFPEAQDRSVTIYNMISPHYFLEDSDRRFVNQIIRSRLYEESGFLPKFFTLKEKENFYNKALSLDKDNYLLIVSTIEPRKNHLRLLAAWEVIKSKTDSKLKLVVVGTLGWDNVYVTDAFKSWIDRGELFMLNAVPAPDLRVLYRHAAATVCPSLGEGFDFSGVESMACGGLTIASNIPVHEEVYGDAAVYFNPYSTVSLVKAILDLLYHSDASKKRQSMVSKGLEKSSEYTSDKILPKWKSFLSSVVVR